MRSRIIVGVILLTGMLAAGTLATSGDGVAPQKQWALVNFVNPVRVGTDILMGPYLIVHDDAKMARGEPCTTIYRFDTKKGPQESAVTFMCRPVRRTVAAELTLTKLAAYDPSNIATIAEYQFAGDTEGHGVPLRSVDSR